MCRSQASCIMHVQVVKETHVPKWFIQKQNAEDALLCRAWTICDLYTRSKETQVAIHR